MVMPHRATNEIAVTMVWNQLGNALRAPGDAVLHECAIVLSLEPALQDLVLRARRRFASAMAANQLEPHITLLYCGVRGPAEIARLSAIAERHAMREVEFRVDGVGQFSNAAGVVTNLHYRVESPALHALHADVVAAYSDAGFVPRTRYQGALYRPHISILDRVILSPADMDDGLPLGSAGPHRAGGAHLVGERRAAIS
jgi:2'-5' RNA ligase